MQQGLLSLFQIGARLKDAVGLGQAVPPLQFQQHIRGHAARARAEFQDQPVLKSPEDINTLIGQAARKERGDLRGRDKVAGPADLACTGAVIAEAGRV